MSTFSVAGQLGYLVLPVAVAIESAGIPVPGEATLITAGVLASAGHMNIVLVVALAAFGAIIGDNLGYLLGRRLGRRALVARGPARRFRRSALDSADKLFGRHGGAAVFVGRFVAIGRVAVAWLAGADRMPWGKFAAWNAAGSVTWATLVGGVAYAVGAAGAKWIGVAGLALAAITVGAFIRDRRREAASQVAAP